MSDGQDLYTIEVKRRFRRKETFINVENYNMEFDNNYISFKLRTGPIHFIKLNPFVTVVITPLK